MSVLLTNGYLVTVDPERRVLESGWLRVTGERITGLGPMGSLRPEPGDQPIDLHGKLVLPGFVNGHTHHWGSLFKNTGEGLLLEPWIERVSIPLSGTLGRDDLRIAAYLASAEQLRTGTTCALNHSTNSNDEDSVRAILEPGVEVGVRQLFGKEIRGVPPTPLRPGTPLPEPARSPDEELDLAERVVHAWDGTAGRVHVGLVVETGAFFALHNRVNDELVVRAVELARRLRLKISNHCSAGTPWLSIREYREATGGGDVDHLTRLGVLGAEWVLAHALHLTDAEISQVASAGASVVTNPVSNAYSCDGIAPLRRLLRAGVPVGLGTDGAYVNCSADMVEQMKFTALIHNVTHYDPALITAERVIEMATIGSARALGLDHLIGSLEVGKRADLAVFDLGKAHHTVLNRPVAGLVFSAHGTDVDLVMVNGDIVLRDGRLTGLPDEAEVLAEACERAASALRRAGLSSRVSVAWRRDPA